MVCIIDENTSTFEVITPTGTLRERAEAAVKHISDTLRGNGEQGRISLTKHYDSDKLIVISFQRII